MDSNLVYRIAIAQEVNPSFVNAIIETESSGNMYAHRVETAYRYLWDVTKNAPFRPLRPVERSSESAPDDFKGLHMTANTEWQGQQASWGPMQVMGAVARELGFTGWFPELCGEAGITYGCKLIHKLYVRHFAEGGWPAVAAAYNAGSPVKATHDTYVNQQYVDKVMSRFSE